MDVVRFCPDIELLEVLFEWDDIATVKVIKSEHNFNTTFELWPFIRCYLRPVSSHMRFYEFAFVCESS